MITSFNEESARAYALHVRSENERSGSTEAEDLSGTYYVTRKSKMDAPVAHVEMKRVRGGFVVELTNPERPECKPMLVSVELFRALVKAGKLRPESEHKASMAAHDLHVLLGRARVRNHYTFCADLLGHDVDSLAALTAEERNRVRDHLFAWD